MEHTAHSTGNGHLDFIACIYFTLLSIQIQTINATLGTVAVILTITLTSMRIYQAFREIKEKKRNNETDRN